MPQALVDRVTERPVVERLSVPTAGGPVAVDLYRPPKPGPHPGAVVCFGIDPTDADDPRVPQMGEAFARSGIAALLLWSPRMRDLAIDADDIDELVPAYQLLLRQRHVDATRSGFVGVCVGGAFALMAAADPRIRDAVRFVFAYAPYSSMWTLATDIASGVRTLGDQHEPWDVDPLTWQVYVRSVTDWLRPDEAQRLRDAFERRIRWNATKTEIVRSPAGAVDAATLSDDARAVLRLLSADADDVTDALRALPRVAHELLTALSPVSYASRITAPRIIVLHDRYDHVIPVGESRRLVAAFAGRPGVRYAELGLRHLRMPQGLSFLRLLREIAKSYLAWYPLFHVTAA